MTLLSHTFLRQYTLFHGRFFFTGVSQFSAYAIAVNVIYWVALIPELREYMKFRRTDAYEKAKKARRERTKKKISQILSRLRIGKK